MTVATSPPLNPNGDPSWSTGLMEVSGQAALRQCSPHGLELGASAMA